MLEEISCSNSVRPSDSPKGWPLVYHYFSRGNKYVDTERARRDDGTHPRGLLSFHLVLLSMPESRTRAVPIQSLLRGRASAVCEVGALSDLDNISVRIADVAARLAVFGDRLRDELRSSTFP